MNSIIKNTIKLILFGAPIISVVVMSSMYFPFITGKNFLFRVIVEICFCLYLVLAIFDRNYRPKWDRLTIAFASFVGVMFMSDVFAINPTKAFFSNFERMEGFTMLAHLFVYFVVLTSVLKDKKDWAIMLYCNISVSVFMTIFAFLQLFGGAVINQSNTRLDGTLGNSAYMATYIVFHIFFLLYLWISDGNKIKGIGNSVATGASLYIVHFLINVYNKDLGFVFVFRYVFDLFSRNFSLWGAEQLTLIIASVSIIKILLMRFGKKFAQFEHIFTFGLYSFVILAQTVVLYYTATRGAILGFIGGLLVTSLIIIFTEKKNKLVRKFATVFFVAILILIVGFYIERKSEFIQNNPVLNRFANMSFSESKTQARGIVWPMAIEAFKENPIIGWGQDNFLFAFAKYYKPEMIRHEPWFDRTHNAFLDWLVAGGILGFLGYLSLYIFAIWTLVKNTVFSIREKSVLIGLFSAYAFLSMFIFDNLTSYMLFILIIGLVDAKPETVKSKLSNSEIVNATFFLASLVLAVILILFVNLNAYRQNIILTKSLGQQKEGVNKNLELIESAINYSSVGRFEALEQMTRLAMSVLSAPSVSSGDKNKFALNTIRDLDKYTKDFPQDVRGFILLGSFLSDVGLSDDAIPLLLTAKDMSPKKQQIYYSLAKAYFAKADKEKDQKYADLGVSTIKDAYDLAPEFDNPRLIYANVLIITGNIKEGIRIIKTMDDPSLFVDKGMVDLLVSKGYKKDALEILELAKKTNPDKKVEIDSLIKEVK